MAEAGAPAAAQQNPPFRTRQWALFASAAPKAVILRRGPKTHFRLIAWDLETDTFTPGQWMKGVVHLSDLSPDGGKLIYWASQYHIKTRERFDSQSAAFDPMKNGIDPRLMCRPKRKIPQYIRTSLSNPRQPLRPNTGTWTAISTPPYFTALAIWPSEGTWTGGGAFHSQRDIVLRESEDGLAAVENVPIPATLRIRAAKVAADFQRAAYAPAFEISEQQKALRLTLPKAGAEWVDWVNVRQGEDMLFGADGRVWRLKRWADVPPERYLAEAECLADFRDMRFELMPAPASAMRW